MSVVCARCSLFRLKLDVSIVALERKGRVPSSFGVIGAGKVTGVSECAPESLTKFGITPCARLAVYNVEFPAYDGSVHPSGELVRCCLSESILPCSTPLPCAW